MAKTIAIRNFGSLNIVKQTNLTADIAAGVSALAVNSNADFTAGPVLLGAPGSQYAEIVTTTSVTPGQSLNLSAATKYPHNNGDPVTMLVGNQLKVYRAADQYGTGKQPDDSNFSLQGDTPIAIDAARVNTSYTDSGWTQGEWYKFTYYNSTGPVETNLSDSRAVQPGQIHYVSLDQVRRAAGLQNALNLSDDVVAEKRDSAEIELNGALLPVYQFPLPQPTNPIVQAIVRNIAAGELKFEQYQNINTQMANDGAKMAAEARIGGGPITSLEELVRREVVLTDANFTEQTIEGGHGFDGWPDATTKNTPASMGGDHGHQFNIDEEY